MKSFHLLAVTAAFSAILLSGCRIVDHKDKDGKNDNVAISTPFGSMKVKTNDDADVSSIGLAVYPGAVPAKDGDKDHDSADVDMSFGDFHLGVKAASFQTSDSTDKVIAFYRSDMARYGEVLECKGDHTIGNPTRTAQGLTCSDEDDHHHVHGSTSSDGIELRAGSEQRRHVVSIESKDGATHIGLVMLNLPTNLHSHSDTQKDPE